MKRFCTSVLVGLLAAGQAAALDLAVPAGANLVFSETSDNDSYNMPIGPYADGLLPTEPVSGRTSVQVWQVENRDLTSRSLLDMLKAQVALQGFETVYSCTTLKCGGFDFRFGTRVAPGPEMYVNLRDFRFTSAQKDSGEALSLLVSRQDSHGFIQLIHVAPTPDAVTETEGTTAAPAVTVSYATPVLKELVGKGHAVLSDLTFESGKSQLATADHASLKALAEYLSENPSRRILLVGHTDATGSLDGNIAVSRSRAQSVRDALVRDLGVPAAQIEAQGAGYVAPVASNETEEGRTANRRVEAVLLPE
jgi:OOP family OmpA-OmpF porin